MKGRILLIAMLAAIISSGPLHAMASTNKPVNAAPSTACHAESRFYTGFHDGSWDALKVWVIRQIGCRPLRTIEARIVCKYTAIGKGRTGTHIYNGNGIRIGITKVACGRAPGGWILDGYGWYGVRYSQGHKWYFDRVGVK